MTAEPRTLTLTGTLELPAATPVPDPDDPAAELIAAVLAVRAGEGGMDLVMRLFRQATVWLETEDGEHGGQLVRSVHVQGLNWLPVFSSLPRLAAFCQATGRGQQRITYGTTTGEQVLESCLPALPPATGLVLDPVADHVLSLPPVPGIAPAAVALDTESRP